MKASEEDESKGASFEVLEDLHPDIIQWLKKTEQVKSDTDLKTLQERHNVRMSLLERITLCLSQYSFSDFVQTKHLKNRLEWLDRSKQLGGVVLRERTAWSSMLNDPCVTHCRTLQHPTRPHFSYLLPSSLLIFSTHTFSQFLLCSPHFSFQIPSSTPHNHQKSSSSSPLALRSQHASTGSYHDSLNKRHG